MQMLTQPDEAGFNDEASLRRLQWRCRRGMLELDLLFTPFVEKHLSRLNHAQIAALDNLLDLPDNDLWNLLAAGTQPAIAQSINLARQQVLDCLLDGQSGHTNLEETSGL